jgi:hypothetical protein
MSPVRCPVSRSTLGELQWQGGVTSSTETLHLKLQWNISVDRYHPSKIDWSPHGYGKDIG